MENREMSKYGEMILPDGSRCSLDDKKTNINNNVLVVGSSGSGKTRSFITPNILECVGSYIITDPKGNLHKKWGKYMESQGYRVLKVSFVNPRESAHYNPLKYVKTTQDIQVLSNMIVFADYKIGSCRDPFWDECAVMMLNSVFSYLLELVKYNEKIRFSQKWNCNISSALELLGNSGRTENGSLYEALMVEHLKKHPESFACKQFQYVNQSATRTFDSIIISTISKMFCMDSDEVKTMLAYDEINFESIAQEKTAVFVEVSDTDRSMDLLVNLFFTQAMNILCMYADYKCPDNELPIPVRFIMDDFATNCTIKGFENMISNIRSRKISVIIALQSFAQLKERYGESGNTIIDNCDTIIYMGGNNPATAREFAIRCDKSVNSIVGMPLFTSWILQRTKKPVMCKNLNLEAYLEEKMQRRIIPYPEKVS